MATQNAMLLHPGEGKSYWVLGDLYTFKATGNETNGAFTVIDQIIQVKNGPPPHIHDKEDEFFYVLEGTFSFLMGDQQLQAGEGAFIYVPKGILHTFQNTGNAPGRLLVTVTPAGLEEFFYQIGTPAEGTTAPPPFDPAILDKVMQLAGKYGMKLQPPGTITR